ncbi:MAG: hypothetical protein IJ180_05410 [Bacteroidales bacterium]|nr:hypothetical protein [Bacteroidales bacterium]
MIRDIVISVIQFIVLVFFQVFILDNIALWGFVNPMIYVWFIILLPYGSARWLTLVASFLIGICVDIFSGDIGINAFACVFIGFIRPFLLNAFSGNIDNVMQRPSITTQGFVNFLAFTTSIVFVHHLICFLVGTFSTAELLQILIRTIVSSLVTIVFIILLDMIFYRQKA